MVNIADILGDAGAGVNAASAARTCELVGLAMKLGKDRVVSTHDVADWLMEVVAPAIREADRKGEL